MLDPRHLGSRGILEKNDRKEKIVGVTITPGSPPEQRNRAAERIISLHERANALEQKCSLPLVARMLADILCQK